MLLAAADISADTWTIVIQVLSVIGSLLAILGAVAWTIRRFIKPVFVNWIHREIATPVQQVNNQVNNSDDVETMRYKVERIDRNDKDQNEMLYVLTTKSARQEEKLDRHKEWSAQVARSHGIGSEE